MLFFVFILRHTAIKFRLKTVAFCSCYIIVLIEQLVKYNDLFWELAEKLKMFSSKKKKVDCERRLFSNE